MRTFMFICDTTKRFQYLRKNVERFSRYFDLLFEFHVMQRTHIVKPISQLHNDDSVVIRHGNKHLSQVFSLLVSVIRNGMFR